QKRAPDRDPVQPRPDGRTDHISHHDGPSAVRLPRAVRSTHGPGPKEFSRGQGAGAEDLAVHVINRTAVQTHQLGRKCFPQQPRFLSPYGPAGTYVETFQLISII